MIRISTLPLLALGLAGSVKVVIRPLRAADSMQAKRESEAMKVNASGYV